MPVKKYTFVTSGNRSSFPLSKPDKKDPENNSKKCYTEGYGSGFTQKECEDYGVINRIGDEENIQWNIGACSRGIFAISSETTLETYAEIQLLVDKNYCLSPITSKTSSPTEIYQGIYGDALIIWLDRIKGVTKGIVIEEIAKYINKTPFKGVKFYLGGEEFPELLEQAYLRAEETYHKRVEIWKEECKRWIDEEQRKKAEIREEQRKARELKAKEIREKLRN